MKKHHNIQRRPLLETRSAAPDVAAMKELVAAVENNTFQRIWSEFTNHVAPMFDRFYFHRQELVKLLERVYTLASVAQNLPERYRDEVLSIGLAVTAGEISNHFTMWMLAAEALQIEAPSEAAALIQQTILGIRRAVNEHDGGKYLIDLVQRDGSLMDKISSVKPNPDDIGRPMGMGEAQQLLLQMAERERNNGASWAIAGQHIKSKLEAIPPGERSGIEEEALRLIKFQQASGEIVERDHASMSRYLRLLAHRS